MGGPYQSDPDFAAVLIVIGGIYLLIVGFIEWHNR
tara:strand:- start:93 stop:197 length:105 start_codon:yes stop_codon:yes gene_type:complete